MLSFPLGPKFFKILALGIKRWQRALSQVTQLIEQYGNGMVSSFSLRILLGARSVIYDFKESREKISIISFLSITLQLWPES
jgi:hypothetical protein